MGLLPVKLQRVGLALEVQLNDGQTVTLQNYYAPAIQEATARRAKAYASKSLGNSQTVRAKQLQATAQLLGDAQNLQDGDSLQGEQLEDVGPLRNVWQVWQEISTDLSGLSNSASGRNEALTPQWNDASQSSTAAQADYLKGTSADSSLQAKAPVSPEEASLWGLARIGLPVAALVALLPSGSSSSTAAPAVAPSLDLGVASGAITEINAAKAKTAGGLVNLKVTGGGVFGTNVTLTFTSDFPGSVPVTQTLSGSATAAPNTALTDLQLAGLVPDGQEGMVTVKATATGFPDQTITIKIDRKLPDNLNFSPIDQDGNAVDASTFLTTAQSFTFRVQKLNAKEAGVTEAGAKWQYSLDSGANWTDGEGTAFTVNTNPKKEPGSSYAYAANEIQVRQVDAAGNASIPVAGAGKLLFPISVDNLAPTIHEGSLDAKSHATFIKSLRATDTGSSLPITWALADANDPTFTLSSTGVLRFRQIQDASASGWDVQVKATDGAGNETTSTLHVNLPTVSDAPVVELPDSSLAGVTQTEAIDTQNGAFKFWAQTGSTVSVVLTHAAEANKTVTINNLPAPASGAQTTVSLTDAQITALGEGPIVVVVSSTRDGGTTTSAPSTFTLDTTAPHAPLLILATDSAPTIAAAGSALLSDGISYASTVHVGVEPGASWKWRVTKLGETAKDSWNTGNGNSLTALSGPDPKVPVSYVYEVQQTDAAGNTGGITTKTFTIDSSAPSSPMLSLQADTGVLPTQLTDRITNNGTVLVTGLEAAALWEWRSTADGSAKPSAWTTGSGSSFTPGTEGKAVYEVRQYDPAGNVSASSTLNAFTWDKTIATPTLTMSVDTGKVGDGITRNHILNVGGVESANGSIWFWKVTQQANGASTTLRDWTQGSGSSFEPLDAGGNKLPDGSYTVYVYATDVAANSTLATPTQLALTFNSGATIKAFITGITTDEGTANNDFITKDNTLVYTGTLDMALGAGQKVQIRMDGNPDGSGGVWKDVSSQPAAGALTFSDDATGMVLTEGAHVVDVRVVDSSSPPLAVAGSEASQTVTVDTSISALTLALVKDTGKLGDGITRDHNFTVGNIEAGASWFWQVKQGSTVVREWVLGTGSSFEALKAGNAPLEDGAYTILVYTKDVAGNSTIDTPKSMDLTFNTNANPIPYLTSITDDTGTAGDFKTNDTTLIYSGVLDKVLLTGQKVQIQINIPGQDTWKDVSTQPGASGTPAALTFSHDESVTTLANGVYPVKVRVVDASGNRVANSESEQQVTVDTVITAPSIAMAVDTGVVGDGITRNHNFTVGNVEVGGSWYWKVTGGAVSLKTGWTQGTGSSFVPMSASNGTLPDGSYTMQVYAEDAAGNKTESSPTSLAVTFNTNANPIPKLASFVSDRGTFSGNTWQTNDSTLSYNGTLDTALQSGQKVQIRIDGSSGGSWKDVSSQPSSGALGFSDSETSNTLSVGSHTIDVRIVDASGTALAGTESSQSITVLPTLAFGSMSPDTGTNTTDWSGSGKKLSFSGTLSSTLPANTTLQFNVDGGTWASQTLATGVTAWSYDNTANALAAGAHTLNYRLVDGSNNPLTDSSGSKAFTVVNPVSFSQGSGVASKPSLFSAVEAGTLYLVDKLAFTGSTTLGVDASGNMQFTNSGTTVIATDAQFNKLLVAAGDTNLPKAVDYSTLTTGRDYALYWQPDGFATQLIAINNNLTNNTGWLSNV
ncbi:MAG: hypothetical protein ORN28_06700 [Rhodoferax sp.]|nr:hypothetical protein [Rhodoferax sp.]